MGRRQPTPPKRITKKRGSAAKTKAALPAKVDAGSSVQPETRSNSEGGELVPASAKRLKTMKEKVHRYYTTKLKKFDRDFLKTVEEGLKKLAPSFMQSLI